MNLRSSVRVDYRLISDKKFNRRLPQNLAASGLSGCRTKSVSNAWESIANILPFSRSQERQVSGPTVDQSVQFCRKGPETTKLCPGTNSN